MQTNTQTPNATTNNRKHNHNALPRHIPTQTLKTHCSALRRVSHKSWQRCLKVLTHAFLFSLCAEYSRREDCWDLLRRLSSAGRRWRRDGPRAVQGRPRLEEPRAGRLSGFSPARLRIFAGADRAEPCRTAHTHSAANGMGGELRRSGRHGCRELREIA